MRRALIPAFLLLLGSIVLGATVFRDDIARATGLAQAVNATIVSPTDAQGNLKVHEQGTAQVAGTVGLSASANSVKLDPTNDLGFCGSATGCSFGREIEASLITVDLEAGVEGIDLEDSVGHDTLFLTGPAGGGQSHYVLPLTQPIRVFDWSRVSGCSADCSSFVSVSGTAVP